MDEREFFFEVLFFLTERFGEFDGSINLIFEV
jgi:hypothetical protein